MNKESGFGFEFLLTAQFNNFQDYRALHTYCQLNPQVVVPSKKSLLHFKNQNLSTLNTLLKCEIDI